MDARRERSKENETKVASRTRAKAAAPTAEHDSLAAAFADVQPLDGDRPARLAFRKTRPTKASLAPRVAAHFHLERHGDRVLGWHGELPPRELATLGTAAAPIEATLDLHGLSCEAARERLAEFLASAHRRGLRTLLVVTGHGRHRPDAGLLRREVPSWLAGPESTDSVLAFATARPAHGGPGAIYVALSRSDGRRTR